MIIKINGWIHALKMPSLERTIYCFYTARLDSDLDIIPLFEHTIEVEAPEFDLTALQVEALRAKAVNVRADATAQITNIERRISELLCIENAMREVAS
jgi:hypothetical protein